MLCLNNKMGAQVDAITSTINEFDYQSMLDAAFTSSDGADHLQCPVQDISNKIVLGAKLASLFFPAAVEHKYRDDIAAFKRRAASVVAANAASNEGGPSMSAGCDDLLVGGLRVEGFAVSEIPNLELAT